ncbi:MAG: hypothetical protein E7071_00945 [Bacteroidales bacterium]|nr:hypothetical protein [Bacteroidales bacterium]
MNKNKFKNRYLAYIFGLLLIVTITWEWIDTIRDDKALFRKIERVLHDKERVADEFLNSLDSSSTYSVEAVPRDIIFVATRNSQILFWSNSNPCSDNLVRLLNSNREFLLLNNSYYDIRHRDLGELDYYALICVKSNYDEQNVYLKNDFSDFFGIDKANGKQLEVKPCSVIDQNVILNIDGEPLFRMEEPSGFKDKSVNYGLLACYLILFLLLFVLYDVMMLRARSVVKQLFIFTGFVLLLIVFFFVALSLKIPDTVFRLALFERVPEAQNIVSIGEMLVYVYSTFQIMAITIYRIKSNRKLLIPFRYYITTAWIIFVYLYASLYSYIIQEIIATNNVCMNIAVVGDIGVASWIAYMIVVLGAVALVVASDRVITVYRDFISFKGAVLSTIIPSVCIMGICFLSWSLLSFREWLVYALILLLMVINRYRIKIDQQRTIYLIILIVLCGYVWGLLRNSEKKKELSDRIEIVEGLAHNRQPGDVRLVDDGYSRLLINVKDIHRNYAFYSFAFYGKNGVLLASSGDYVFHRRLSDWVPLSRQGFLVEYDGYEHLLYSTESGDTIVASLPLSYFNTYYYLNLLYIFLLIVIFSSYSLIYHLNIFEPFAGRSIKVRVKQAVNVLIFVLFLSLTVVILFVNYNSFKSREQDTALKLIQLVSQRLEESSYDSIGAIDARIDNVAKILRNDINLYEKESGRLVATSREEIFGRGYVGNMVEPTALSAIRDMGENRVIVNEAIGEMNFKSVYAPVVLNGVDYIVNVPYFVESYGFGRELATLAVFAINIAIVLMMISFTLSAWIADWMLHPLILVTENLKRMRLTGKNEKIKYGREDEIGIMVKQYNDAIDTLEENVRLLAKSEREGAWREMARQIAHEIKNPLTPMKLNIQLLQRYLSVEEFDSFKTRFMRMSAVIMEQIDTMANTASAFSDFAKLPKVNPARFDVVDMLRNLVLLFQDLNVEFVQELPERLEIFSDRALLGRVIMNLIKNSCQSIPDGEQGRITISLVQKEIDSVEISIVDNGVGIEASLINKIFEPNFTTKSNGMGLGLAISKRIIETLGGTITFLPNYERGTKFIVTLNNINE